jgi:hypothetical protein
VRRESRFKRKRDRSPNEIGFERCHSMALRERNHPSVREVCELPLDRSQPVARFLSD